MESACGIGRNHLWGRGITLLPLLVAVVLLAGCGGRAYQPTRECGILALQRLGELDQWEPTRQARVQELRHSREQERGYTAPELTMILRLSGEESARNLRLASEEELWKVATGGTRPLILVQSDVQRRLFPGEYHWVLVEEADAGRERYRVFLADGTGQSSWWSRRRVERYHRRGDYMAVIAGDSSASHAP